MMDVTHSPTAPAVHATRLVPPRAWRDGLWTAAGLARRAREHALAVAQLGLRTRHPAAGDALALAASGGRLVATELATALDDGLREVSDAEALAALALLWSADREGVRQSSGARAYRWLLEQARLPPSRVHHQAAGQALYLAGQFEVLRAWLPTLDRLPDVVRDDLTADLAHPALSAAPGQPAPEATWLELLSRRFYRAGLTPLRLHPETTGHLFDRLGALPPPAAPGGPLVTVIIPAYQPDEGLVNSVASITAQSYPDLEIIIVDDASGPAYADLFERVAATDERIRVLTMARNGGSYLGRRAAIQQSRGDLITTQDADDWSHPQRIEHQVAILADQPAAPASRSLAVRAKDDLTHQWFGYPSVRPNASSLMVRREVMDRLGTFLPIRKGADSEYAERLVALAAPIADTGTPLGITRLRVGSLSRADFSFQWHHPDRVVFRGSYRAWHRSLRLGSRRPTDEQMPEVPAAFTRGLERVPVPPREYAVILLADLSGPPAGAAHAAVTRPSAGPIGLWHVESPSATRPGRAEMHPDWFDLALERSDVHVVSRTEQVHTRAVLVLDLPALTLASAQPATVSTDQVLLALSGDLAVPGPGTMPVDLLGAADAAARWWGRPPRWTLAPGADETEVREAFPGLTICHRDTWAA